MVGEADFASTVHFGSLPIQLWQSNFRCCSWICHWNLLHRVQSWLLTLGYQQDEGENEPTYVKLHIKLIFEQILNVPTLSKPSGAFFI